MVPKNVYQWGHKLDTKTVANKFNAAFGGAAGKINLDRYHGMVKMPRNGGGHTYMTFRVMGEWQTGRWILPAQPGRWIAKGVVDTMGPLAEKAFAEALRRGG